MKPNCWEKKGCGCQPGGPNIGKLGVCPASENSQYDGINEGNCGGRYCWKVNKTLCGGTVQEGIASKMGRCLACDVFKEIKVEEGDNFKA